MTDLHEIEITDLKGYTREDVLLQICHPTFGREKLGAAAFFYVEQNENVVSFWATEEHMLKLVRAILSTLAEYKDRQNKETEDA